MGAIHLRPIGVKLKGYGRPLEKPAHLVGAGEERKRGGDACVAPVLFTTKNLPRATQASPTGTKPLSRPHHKKPARESRLETGKPHIAQSKTNGELSPTGLLFGQYHQYSITLFDE